jgi:NAD(P)-dependent dehydrogenase (short-subunit alcohol dehydrogenase family)
MATALVTGCSPGFGLQAAVKLAGKGVTVVATMRNLSKADRLRSAARSSGIELELVELDVTSRSSREQAIARATERCGHIDILVNNAGSCWIGAAEELGEGVLRDQFETNVFGAYSMATALLPSMRTRRSGRIVTASAKH